LIAQCCFLQLPLNLYFFSVVSGSNC
jgi:hypothetical protein